MVLTKDCIFAFLFFTHELVLKGVQCHHSKAVV